ncbi:hypothetical protein Bca52824_078769 [Brassica carinata]|uniref:Uncharacterized protein n=1 Tax=Brassica carinata TaxID=52824 RepID=A0A8X7PXC0_BRACI|nr:hypothetical protein Bca52824_078769 [Brassica carinata]
MPEDMRLFIVSKMASTSPIDYFHTIITCKRLSFGPDNYSVAKALNLSPLVNQPSLANRYQLWWTDASKPTILMPTLLKIIGLHHIHIASKGGHVQGTYVYGVLLMAIGETENGVKIINKLTDDKGISVVEDCMANFQRSMERPFLHMKETYVSSMKKMWPQINCHPQEGADTTVCSNCFQFFLLTKFYKTMLGFNDLLD